MTEQKIKIAICDPIGLVYNGDTVKEKALGGSESAVVFIAKELAKIGFDVQVFNNCKDASTKPGVFDGVEYIDLTELHKPNSYTCDIMIGTRSVLPFLPEWHWNDFNYPPVVFRQLKDSANLRVLCLHDTFVSGDHILEELVVGGHIDQIFTLSDFHTTYIANCDHGKKRNFEVLKDRFFQTRNGAVKYIDNDINTKDPNHFVFNASITKGMLPLVLEVWPLVKQRIPQARLTVIGGFYRFRDGAPPDAQEAAWHQLVADPIHKQRGITFTGIIPQRQIADILANAQFMLYPGAFPETFGISTLESLLYNTPLITTKFGALEETAIDLACYKIDYAIEPNNLFPWINKAEQIKKFVDITVHAHGNTYLTYQKMHACNRVRDIAGWDTVALQWKQQFFKSLGLFLPVEEYRQVSVINRKVQNVFGRRFINPVERVLDNKLGYEQRIHVIIPVYNGEAYIRDCILSVAAQDYSNYHVTIIDDASTDRTVDTIHSTLNSLPGHIQDNFVLVTNSENVGSLANYVTTIMKDYEFPMTDIIMLLDGDDSLVNDPSIFDYYNALYDGTVDFTYGSMWSKADKIPLIAQEYPAEIQRTKAFRDYRFPWNMPYTHLRTFAANILHESLPDACKDEHGEFFRAGGDTALFYNLIERARPNSIVAVPHIMVNYNDLNPINDYKVHAEEQTRTATYVMKGNRRV